MSKPATIDFATAQTQAPVPVQIQALRDYRREVESASYPEMRLRKPLFAALVDTGAAVLNAVLPCGTDVRRGDYHVILRKR